jgi:hypothetical protein
MFPAGGIAVATASDRGTSLLGQEPPQDVFQHSRDLVWQSLCERLPQNVIEPTEKTAPPPVVSKYMMSARIKVCGRSPVIVVDVADELRAIVDRRVWWIP